MLDIRRGAHAPPASPIEFVTIQFAPLEGGTISVSLRSTVFDETEFNLIDQDIANECVRSLDDALSLIRQHVHFAPSH